MPNNNQSTYNIDECKSTTLIWRKKGILLLKDKLGDLNANIDNSFFSYSKKFIS